MQPIPPKGANLNIPMSPAMKRAFRKLRRIRGSLRAYLTPPFAEMNVWSVPEAPHHGDVTVRQSRRGPTKPFRGTHETDVKQSRRSIGANR